MIKPEDVTIIIPHLGETIEQQYSLEKCLNSLKETCNISIIVSSNKVESWAGRVLKEEILIGKQGQCKAVNAAVATTNTPWILVTNDDMIYAPGWFEKLTTLQMITRDVSLDDQNILCISPKLIEPRPGASTFEVYPCGGAGGDFDRQKWFKFAENYPRQGQAFRTGFNLPFLIRRDLWDLVGGYDINYDPWGSNGDSDLEYKIKLAGVQPYQNTNCIVYHFSQTSGTFLPENDSFRFKNYAYFKEKWGFDRTDDGIWEATFKIPTKKQGRKFNPWWEGFYSK